MGLYQSKEYKKFVNEQINIYAQKFQKQLDGVKYFSKEIKESIKFYTSDSDNFNIPKFKARYKPENDKLLEAFKIIPPLETNVVLYRGLEYVKNIDISLLYNKFISTTTVRKVAFENFTDSDCCMLVINVSSKSKVLPVLFESRYYEEFEVILPPYGTWELISTEIVKGQRTYYLNYKNYD